MAKLVLTMTDDELKELDEFAILTKHVTGVSKKTPNRSGLVREAIQRHLELIRRNM